MTIYIHEFSTGIQAEETADGGWVSKGFTGQYMNKTIDPIPRVVQEAISNRDFAVAEGASSEEPAFIGREMAGYEEEWSVIAVVTRGKDDRGRSASVYRYFLSEGLGNLGKILSWLNAQKQAEKNIIFNPFDTQVSGQPHEYDESESNLTLRPELESLLESSPPIIIPSDSPCAPLIVNKMAQAIANSQSIAWAYNVEALEEPRGFQVIQPASSRAEDLLKKAIASKPNTPAPVSGEKAIISAINGLVKRDRVKPEQVETIENALGNPQIDRAYWESIFKGRGADKALKQGIYSADMVRLLTLKAMLIPETLPEFLVWLGKDGKKQEAKEVSNNFQVEINKAIRQFPESAKNLITKIYQGVISIIPQLIKQPQLIDSVVWLLSSERGIWRYFYCYQIKNEIDNDLSSMRYYGRGKQGVDFKLVEDKEWQKIFDETEVYWRSLSRSQPQYQPLAKLFSQLGNYQLSALFHHISSGIVPKEVFYKLTSRGFYTQVYKIRVKREIGSLESLYLKTVEIGGQIVPVYLVAILMAVTIPVSFFGGKFILKSEAKEPSGKEINQTQESLGNLTNFFVELGMKEKDIEKSLALIINSADKEQTVNLSNLGQEKPDTIIQTYQNSFVKKTENAGAIKPQDQTYKALKCDLSYENSLSIETINKELCKDIFTENKQSIRKIVNDFVIYKKETKNNIENEIIKIFEQVNSDENTNIYRITQDNERGRDLVAKYQEKLNISDNNGSIKIGDDTWNALKCQVAKNLGMKKIDSIQFKISGEKKDCMSFDFAFFTEE